MKHNIFNWIFRNFNIVFNVMGIGATIYFGAFYIPDYYMEAQRTKIESANHQIVQSIKELIYSDSLGTISEIKSIINSKEAAIDVELDKSPRDYLLRSQESFIEDKYIPLYERRNYVAEIQNYLDRLPSYQKETNKENNENSLPDVISIIITIFILLIGYISARSAYVTRKAREEELNNEVNEIIENNESKISDNHRFNIYKNIEKVLNELGFDSNSSENLFDFTLNLYDTDFIVNVKLLNKAKISLRYIELIISQLKNFEGVCILIHNSSLTAIAESRIRDFNKIQSTTRLTAILYKSKEDLQIEIKKLLE